MIGLGTFRNIAHPEEIVTEAILKHGYRHIDTAAAYKNEAAIGRALQTCFNAGIKREEIFITTKLWIDSFADPEKALRESL